MRHRISLQSSVVIFLETKSAELGFLCRHAYAWALANGCA